MSTQSFRRQTQIAFDVNVKVNNTDTAGNIVTDDITLYYADSLILDIAMGLFDDTVEYYPRLYDMPAYISITGNNNTPYTKDLTIRYISASDEQLNNLKNYIDSIKNYQNYINVIKCSPFFRATPLVYKHILG